MDVMKQFADRSSPNVCSQDPVNALIQFKMHPVQEIVSFASIICMQNAAPASVSQKVPVDPHYIPLNDFIL